jgi:pimeloyl-ACP methyl ester carboxylesterase
VFVDCTWWSRSGCRAAGRPPIIFVHGICSHPTDWDQLRLSLAAYLNTNESSLYPNPQVYVGVATGPSAADVYFYDDSGNQLSGAPPSSARFFSIAFNPDAFGSAQQCPSSSCNPIAFDEVSVMQQPIKQKGDELAALIANIKQITGVPKVILIAHSMGGLDARSYLENLGTLKSHTQGNDSDVLAVTTIDTPHLGSPMSDIVALIQANGGIAAFISDLPFAACFASSSEDMNELEPGSQTVNDLNYQSSAASDIPSTVSFDSMVNYVLNPSPGSLYDLEGGSVCITSGVESDGAVCKSSQSMTNALASYPYTPAPHVSSPSTPFTGTCPSGLGGTDFPLLLHQLGCVGIQQSTELQLDVDVINNILKDSIVIEPQNVTIASGQNQQFSASLNDSTPVVYWTLLENPASTSINSYGTFQAGSTGTFRKRSEFPS